MNINGLTDEQVIENRKKYGRNIFSKKKKDSFTLPDAYYNSKDIVMSETLNYVIEKIVKTKKL